MTSIARIILVAVGSLLAVVTSGSKADALSCTATISPISFGAVDILAGGSVQTSGLLDVECSVTLLDLASLALGIAVCPGIGSGSGGDAPGGRLLAADGGPDSLLYQLTPDPAGQVPWGGFSGGLLFGDPPLFRIPAAVGTVSGSWPVYATLFAGQSTAPPDTYRSSFVGLGGGGTEIRYGSLASLLGCGDLSAALQTSANFSVDADISKNCLVSTDEVNFGTHGLLNVAVEAEGAIHLACTMGTTYAVALEPGTFPSSQRQMTNAGRSVSYALFQDSQRTLLWGNAAGETASGSGVGAEVTLPVYGLVPAQQTPPAGVYRDSVIVTVTY